jgi:hypothetical protein
VANEIKPEHRKAAREIASLDLFWAMEGVVEKIAQIIADQIVADHCPVAVADHTRSGFYVCYQPGREICWPQGYPTREQAEKKMAELVEAGMDAAKIHVVEK